MTNGIGNRLRAWLARPYPLWRGPWLETRFVGMSTVLAAAFAVVARPFGLSSIPDFAAVTLIAELAGAVLIASVALRVALPALLQHRWDESRWTVGTQIVREVAEVIAVAGALMAVLAWNGHVEISATRARSFVVIVALCASIPVVLHVWAIESRLRRRNEARAAQLSEHDAAPADVSPGRLVRARDGAVELATGELRYVHAEHAFVDVVFVRDGERSHRLLRVALSGVERQFNDGSVVRCHRAYLVAHAAVVGVRGNAQGFRLTLRDLAETVPVSRTHTKSVLALIERRAENTDDHALPAEPAMQRPDHDDTD